MTVKSVSPMDGRYGKGLVRVNQHFSEWGLMKFRLLVETEWLITMSSNEWLEVRPFASEEVNFLRRIVSDFDESSALRIKAIEETVNHDVKSVEYFLKETLQSTSLADVLEFVHFGCTSEDINNLSYALMLKSGIEEFWLPLAESFVGDVANLADDVKDIPMLSRTHGQPASPTTVGKELAVFVCRWQRQLRQIRSLEYLGKFNGSVGNFNAQTIAYPEAPWEEMAKSFVERLGLSYNPVTTQIEPHDYMAECFHALVRFNNILLDFDRDVWLYISMGYFKQRAKKGEVGSSVMPHKVNPVDFETSEANVGLSNAILNHLANKLAVSRLQRDISDSSAKRNIGVGIAHACVALQCAQRGLGKLSVNPQALDRDLSAAWEVLGEAIQTVMRKCGYDKPYEMLKDLTRGTTVTQEQMRAFISDLELPEGDKQRLLELSPHKYVGLASDLTRHMRKRLS